MDCLYAVEESLQRKIRSIILLQINQEKENFNSESESYAHALEEYWQNWYVSTTYSKHNTKGDECDIEATKSYFGSIWYQLRSECYIQHDASEILWLLKQGNERMRYFNVHT